MPSDPDTKPPNVLVVDDSPTNRQLISNILQNDYVVECVASGTECLNCVGRVKPELILMDVEMPGKSGYETTKRLKANPATRDIPVIFVTGLSSDESEEKGFNLGAVDYISKPFKPAILNARVRTHILLKQQQDHLRQLAMRDQLTGTFNRHYLVETVEERIAYAKYRKAPLSILVLDLDYFKKVNDTFGHTMGDLILKAVGEFLLNRCSVNSIVSRFGGEEFVVVRDTSIKNACYLAEVLRHRISELKPSGIPITTSIGVAQLDSQDEDFRSFFKRADAALYEAKANGRDCVVSAESTGSIESPL